jgi:hypothetical protein
MPVSNSSRKLCSLCLLLQAGWRSSSAERRASGKGNRGTKGGDQAHACPCEARHCCCWGTPTDLGNDELLCSDDKTHVLHRNDDRIVTHGLRRSRAAVVSCVQVQCAFSLRCAAHEFHFRWWGTTVDETVCYAHHARDVQHQRGIQETHVPERDAQIKFLNNRPLVCLYCGFLAFRTYDEPVRSPAEENFAE